ncbi:Sirohydrochlorin cobaltochelatase OS=Streptomyces aurantiogriseus OX=66870 GN=GCM10010251_38560 PE=4 SV=1 [Streptomyces aurantiogriseus]
MNHLKLEREGAVVTVRLHRPHVLNALNSALLAELLDVLVPLDADPDVGCVVVTGSERAFAAGADIREMAGKSAVEMAAEDYFAAWEDFADLRTPKIRTRVAAPLGPHPLLVEALHSRLVEAGWRTRMTDSERRTSAVVLAAAGSRDPDSAVDTRRTAQLLAERLGVPVVPAYATTAGPTVPTAIRALTARGRHRIAVASYFTAPGRFATECAEAAPWIASAPLGPHEAMARLVLHRYDQALAAPASTAPELASA